MRMQVFLPDTHGALAKVCLSALSLCVICKIDSVMRRIRCNSYLSCFLKGALASSIYIMHLTFMCYFVDWLRTSGLRGR